ncbi:transcriptional regulator with XRE-family HTH domain [Mesorhizobium robiniae]|uniref:Transcriptional regulator with XRE-family HTH domain n=1 Tax=Mesorhizobium robiniae TaxID=559315 RepID=A0ABV2GLC3_9HYPH
MSACEGRAHEDELVTPFGEKLRALRSERGVSQKAMAEAIGVSAAYLSALEHGRRGAPTWTLIQKIIGYFNVIWDDAEELARLAETSHPRVKLDTSGLTPAATELANLLAENIEKLDEAELRRITASIRAALKQPK